MADITRTSNGLDRREFMTAVALAGASSLVFGPQAVMAADERYPAIRKAAEAGREAAIKRIQDWIALPSIAAESWSPRARRRSARRTSIRSCNGRRSSLR